MREDILVADGCTWYFTWDFSATIGSLGLLCAEGCGLDADRSGVLFLGCIDCVYATGVTFLDWDFFLLDFRLGLWRVVDILSFVRVLTGLVEDSWLIDFHIFSFVCDFGILVLLSRLNASRSFARRHSVYLWLGVGFLFFRLLLQVLLIISSRSPGLWYWSFAADNMNEVIFIHDWLVTFGAGLGPGFACCKVGSKGSHGNIQLAVLTKFGLVLASLLVVFVIRGGKLFRAVWAFLFPVKLFLVFFFEVYVEHLVAGGAFFDVSPAVAEMCCDLGFREVLEAVVASLYWFAVHILELFQNYKLLQRLASNMRLRIPLILIRWLNIQTTKKQL